MNKQQRAELRGGSPAESYERHFVPAIGKPLASHLVEIAAPRPGERVLDVACGTGVATRLAARRVGATGTVAGLDVNAGMLAVARTTVPPDTAVEWHEASAERMPLPDRSFDLVLCQMGLQFVSDKPAALREMHRVLAPGGRLALNVPGPTPPLMAVLAEALARHLGDEAAGFVRLVFSLHDPAELQALIANAGFGEVSTRADTKTLLLPAPEEFLWGYVYGTPLAGAVASADEERLDSVERDVLEGWQEFAQGGGLKLRLRVVTATARVP